MCFDRRGRFSQRRLFAGAVGTSIGFLVTALFSYLLFSEAEDPFIHPIEPGLTTKSFSIHCLVITSGNHTAGYVEQETTAIIQTWGKRCTSLDFVGGSHTPLWKAWQDAISKGKHTAAQDDWIIITGLGTYIIMENLRKMVEPYTGEDTSSFVWSQEFPHKEAVTPPIIISYFGLEKLYAYAKKDNRCMSKKGDHLQVLRKCLTLAGLVVADNRDSHLQHRMLPYHMRDFLHLTTYWEEDNKANGLSHAVKPGVGCCSRDLVSVVFSTEYLSHIHFYEYLLYKIVY